MADPNDLNDVMRALGRLEAGQDRMRTDFDAEKAATKDSRSRMHAKLEKIEEDVSIVGKVAAQARDKADKVEKIVETDVKPVTDDVKRYRQIGFGALALIGFAFTALGITVATVGEGFVQWVRAWLRIS